MNLTAFMKALNQMEPPMIQYDNTVSGIFVRRLNRFVAEVLMWRESCKAEAEPLSGIRNMSYMPVADLDLTSSPTSETWKIAPCEVKIDDERCDKSRGDNS